MATSDKYCKDCLHCSETGKFAQPFCKSPNRDRNLVTGDYKYLPCHESRDYAYYCGSAGNWFELKKE